jgi:predicted TIM-barrel fold metal-dependent hydrolase
VDGPSDATPGGLRLVDFHPRSQLRARHAAAPACPSQPAIDAHNHLGATPFSDGWDRRSPAELAATLDASNIAAIVDLDGGWGDALARELEHWAPLGDRVAVFAGLEYAMWAEHHDFGEVEATRLRAAAGSGARGLKVWKLLGLHARDATGRRVPVDDPRLDALWAAAGALGLPVTIHVADPIAFFEPLDASNERYEELVLHPDWHVWPTRPPRQLEADGFPPFDELIDGLEAVVARHPGTTFIGAHIGCAPEDLVRVDRMLAAHRNWHIDIAARIAELGRQPYSARDLILRWPDRVLFGTDAPPDPAAWAVYARFLETRDESFPYEPDGGPGSQGRWAIHGLGLPDDVLRAVYADNARRLIFGPAAGVPPPHGA